MRLTDLFPPTTFNQFAKDYVTSRAVEEVARRTSAGKNLLSYIHYTQPDYVAQKFHVAICGIVDTFMEEIEQKRSPRYIILAPPRHGKSKTTTTHGSAYINGSHPEWFLMNLAYNKELATDFGREIRAQITGTEHRNVFPESMPRADSAAVDFITMEDGGKYMAQGVGGAITGRGAHAMFIDDPIKGREEADSEREREKMLNWYMSVARTRLMPGGGILITLTPWHEDDLAHMLIKIGKQNPDADQWKVFRFPAIAEENDLLGRKPGEALDPDRYPIEELKSIRASITTREWNCLYQCNPTAAEGNFFTADLIDAQTISTDKVPAHDTMVKYVSVDLAITQKNYSDSSVIWPFGVDQKDDVYFFKGMVHRKMTSLEIVDTIIDVVVEYHCHGAVIERGHIYHAIRELLKKRMRERRVYFRILDPAPTKDKVTRAHPLQARMEQGKVFFESSPQLRDVVIPEFLAFPNGAHDDTVDAATQAIERLNDIRKFIPRKETPPPRVIDPFSREGLRLRTRRTASTPKDKKRLDLFG